MSVASIYVFVCTLMEILFVPSQHLFNSAAFKARTKLRNKVRDKRADVMWGLHEYEAAERGTLHPPNPFGSLEVTDELPSERLDNKNIWLTVCGCVRLGVCTCVCGLFYFYLTSQCMKSRNSKFKETWYNESL